MSSKARRNCLNSPSNNDSYLVSVGAGGPITDKIGLRVNVAHEREGGDFKYGDVPGFGVRVYRSGRKVYIVQARGPAGSKRTTIGRHGEILPEAARRQAVVMIDRIKRGEDPIWPSWATC